MRLYTFKKRLVEKQRKTQGKSPDLVNKTLPDIVFPYVNIT